MFELVRLGVRSGLRGQGFRILLIITCLLLGTALLAGSFSGRQPLTVSLDVGLSGLRFVLLLMVLLWVQDLLARDIERKTIYFVLAYPVSRGQFLASRFIAVLALSALALLVVGGALWLMLQLFGSGYSGLVPPDLGSAYLWALLGIWLDLMVVAAFAILLASLSTTPYLPLLLGFAFALAARGLGSTIAYLRSARSDPLHETLFSPLLEHAYVWLPDLSRLDWRGLSLYRLAPDYTSMGLAVLNAGAYTLLLLVLAMMIFKRRNFV